MRTDEGDTLEKLMLKAIQVEKAKPKADDDEASDDSKPDKKPLCGTFTNYYFPIMLMEGLLGHF